MTEAERIAKGLSPQQREALLAMPIKNAGAKPVFDDCMALFNMELAELYQTEHYPNGERVILERGMKASATGLEVRAILEAGGERDG